MRNQVSATTSSLICTRISASAESRRRAHLSIPATSAVTALASAYLPSTDTQGKFAAHAQKPLGMTGTGTNVWPLSPPEGSSG